MEGMDNSNNVFSGFSQNNIISGVSQVACTDAQALQAMDVVLLDVRNPDEYEAGHAPDVMFIPLGELEARVGELDPTIPIVAICRLGGRSQAAAEFLTAQGFIVANMTGGMAAWSSDGLNVLTDEGTQGIVI
jgi:rhodanese-related sulfurtransferase